MEVLAHDEQPGLGQQVVDVRHAAGQAVLARQHGQRGAAVAHRLDRRLEGLAGQGGHARVGDRGRPGRNRRRAAPGRRSVAVMRRFPAAVRRARSRSSGVSTPNGPCGTWAQPMRMPASSARNCSRRSRCSSGDSGSATKRASAGAAIGVDADVVPARPGAPGDRRRARNTARGAIAAPSANSAGGLDERLGGGLRVRQEGHHQGGDVDLRVGQRGQHGAQAGGRHGGQVALQVHHHVVRARRIERGQRGVHAVGARGQDGIGQHRRAAGGAHRRRRSRGRRRPPRPARYRPPAPAPARARSSACRGCRPAACRAAGWRPCGRG